MTSMNLAHRPERHERNERNEPALPVPPSTKLLTREGDWADGSLRAAWDELLASSDNLDATFQTPEWFRHAARGTSAAIVEHIGPKGAADGIVPVVKAVESLEFVADRFVHQHVDLRAAIVLGGEPLIAPGLQTFDEVLRAVDSWAPDCDVISFPLVRAGSPTWKNLCTSRVVQERFRLYVPLEPGAGEVHSIDLPATFKEYTATLGAKRRANFKRKLNVLTREGVPAKLRRFERPDEVAEFLALVRPIAAKSWQHAIGSPQLCPSVDWHQKLGDLAARGIWRGYVLFCGDVPTAFGLGYQDCGTFHFRATGFDATRASWSPGTVLMYLMIEDLLDHGTRATRHMCFCFGDASYKRLFSNVHTESFHVLLLRRTWKNDLVRSTHIGFRRLVTVAKALLARVRPPEAPNSAHAEHAEHSEAS
jgi:CelD/BcsL family acetyltransferase involved in cellulose biosynthesis